MPGTLHQGILLLYQEDPWLAFDLLGLRRPVIGVPIDRRGEVELDGPEPLTVRQGFPDLVMVHRHPDDETEGLVITVEAQKDPDHSKRWMIPVYQSNLAEEHRLDTYVVVVSLNARVSRLIRAWRRRGPPRVDVLLHDVATIPKSPWLDEPAQRPLAAVLVGTLHGYAGDLDAARIAFHTARTLGGRRSRRHAMTVLSALPKHQREQLIGELPVQQQHDWMDVERRSGTYQFGREEGREEGLAQARAIVREVIVGSLEARGLVVDEASAAAIDDCNDLSTLQLWARRAVTAARVEELFEPE